MYTFQLFGHMYNFFPDFYHQVSLLQEEKANALEEKRRIEERLQETAEDPKNSGLLRRQVESLKEQIYKLETCMYILTLFSSVHI